MNATGPNTRPAWDELVPALTRLDALLGAAIERAQELYGPGAAADQFRGLYVGGAEVTSLLDRRPGEPLLWTPVANEGGGALRAFAERFGLSTFDVDVVLLALAPELDRRYERIYAFLQDNVSSRAPTVDLAINLLCRDAAERLEMLARFGPSAPLLTGGLVRLIPDGPVGSDLARSIRLDPMVVASLAGRFELAADIQGCCQLVAGARVLSEVPVHRAAARELAALATAPGVRFIAISGGDHEGRGLLAEAAAATAGRQLLRIDAVSLARHADAADILARAALAARLCGAVLAVDGADFLAADSPLLMAAEREFALAPGPVVLSGEAPVAIPGHDVAQVRLAPLDYAERRSWWRECIEGRELALDEDALDDLAARLQLSAGQVREAVTEAWTRALTGVDADLTADGLFAAACALSSADLATLTQRVRPRLGWDDIVLPADARAQLQELCARVAGRRRVLDEWGFGRRLSIGRGTAVLFSGPPGTGKTMAAQILAAELRLDLCKVDLSSVVSKYIGETEKNLSQVFAAAERANAILFFDEADALFGKRSEVRDSHDRYANVEISYLLQKMEEYDGVAILATNLRQNLDESFIRRLAFTIHFPFPDEASRAEIWRTVWPAEVPLGGDVSADELSHQFKLAGGNIKNVALAAAYLAADDGGVVTLDHVLRATRREYQKLGKVLSIEGRDSLVEAEAVS